MLEVIHRGEVISKTSIKIKAYRKLNKEIKTNHPRIEIGTHPKT